MLGAINKAKNKMIIFLVQPFPADDDFVNNFFKCILMNYNSKNIIRSKKLF